MPEQLEAVFTRMVAKNIDDRYQTMIDVIADLERCGSSPAQNDHFSSVAAVSIR